MKIILFLILGLMSINASPVESDVPAVEPEYLDQLRDEGKYEEFSELLGIPDAKLAEERDTEGRKEISSSEAMMHEELEFGDMIFSTENDEARQIMRFDKYPNRKWRGRRVPYEISRRDFDANQRQSIQTAIDYWNRVLNGFIRLTPRRGEGAYVFVFSGNGCYSFVGRRGEQQPLSLDKNGCLYKGTVIHEFEHAIGFTHEQNRHDRNNFVDILWENIPDNWKSQYHITNSEEFGIVNRYDYYSIMHYPYYAPGTIKPAFRIKQNGIHTNRIGTGDEFTPTDIAKIQQVYRN